MARLIVVEPMLMTVVTANRGTGADNLKTPDPKEVWADESTGTATITVDLGAARPIDTILLGYVSPPLPGATWSITGGIAGSGEFVLQTAGPLRVPDVAGSLPARTHALYVGIVQSVRYLAITVTQSGGNALTIGTLVVGRAFVAQFGQEWGGGRQPIDTGVATPLPSGGFSVVEGVRKRLFSWTFGDLSVEEADQFDLLANNLGETRPGLVVEDPDRSAGLRSRIHYGLFKRWVAYERRNRKQTRWEVAIEQWV